MRGFRVFSPTLFLFLTHNNKGVEGSMMVGVYRYKFIQRFTSSSTHVCEIAFKTKCNGMEQRREKEGRMSACVDG